MNSPSPAAPSPFHYAGFWRRCVANAIDTFLISIVIFSFMAVSGVTKRENLFVPVVVLLNWLYYALLESSKRQSTIGKGMLGIKVTDMAGNRVSFARATGRHFGKIVSGAILGIGYLMAAFTKQKQALHDLMAHCLVLRR
jgi:uncharacterized RDD family membrane protein YckC